MDKTILKIESEGLNRYFKTLSSLGYKSYEDVNRTLVIMMIEEILTSELSFFVTEKDYRSICNALYCMLGNNCLYDLPSYNTGDSLYHGNKNNLVYRISEDDILRVSEDNLFRVEV